MPFIRIAYHPKDAVRIIDRLAEDGDTVICKPNNEVVVSTKQLKKLIGTNIKVLTLKRNSVAQKEVDLKKLLEEEGITE